MELVLWGIGILAVMAVLTVRLVMRSRKTGSLASDDTTTGDRAATEATAAALAAAAAKRAGAGF